MGFKTNLYINGKKTTLKDAVAIVGDKELKRMVSQAKKTFKEDPFIQNDFYLGIRKGILTIDFC